MRQLIVDLKAEYPDFSLREIADICFVQFERRPSHNTVKQVLADGPLPSRTGPWPNALDKRFLSTNEQRPSPL